jgi:hypothetical protein
MIGASTTGPYIALDQNAARQWNNSTWAPITRKATATSNR